MTLNAIPRNLLSRATPVILSALIALGPLATLPTAATAQVAATEAQQMAFRQAVAEGAAQDDAVAAFYRETRYAPLWTTDDRQGQDRRRALIEAMDRADAHGLPGRRFDPAPLMDEMRSARTPRALGLLEAKLSRAFLDYAKALQTGILDPRRVVSGIKRDVPVRDRLSQLKAFAEAQPYAFFRALPPSTAQYAHLMKEKMRLERLVAAAAWGATVPSGKLEPGDSGASVVALRNRLVTMGYLERSASRSYDAAIQTAVQRFQTAHGLAVDGIAGPSTIDELNVGAEERLHSVIVAMERERWLNRPRGKRHILVNLSDFSARIVDNDVVTFETRAVIGAPSDDRQSPEFSDVMEHMVINPTWNVPRSIAVKEYLPQMRRNPNAAGHLRIVDSRGRTVPRSAINFAALTPQNFPFDLKQPPSNRNALGLVKFMFPNRYNIYLHDTPQKSLFDRESRAFSHGCIRLHRPFEFAYALLARQTNDPEGFFKARLNTGRETTVMLDEPVPVHLIYRTAVANPKGEVEYRRDVYGRDARIWQALAGAGVATPAVQG
ncbi:L,D-transpeptidase family protein [Aquicoccus sp. SCR17]|nr:L,D-transpeptidase family protein [Carideicomes alvinocaridis]